MPVNNIVHRDAFLALLSYGYCITNCNMFGVDVFSWKDKAKDEAASLKKTIKMWDAMAGEWKEPDDAYQILRRECVRIVKQIENL